MSEWKAIDTAPKDGSKFEVCGGTWQTDDQGHGLKNKGDVIVRYVIRRNSVDSPFVMDDLCAIKNPTHWREC